MLLQNGNFDAAGLKHSDLDMPCFLKRHLKPICKMYGKTALVPFNLKSVSLFYYHNCPNPDKSSCQHVKPDDYC